MIDIHSHILPGIDDGSRSTEESVSMLKIAAESGITDIVATPHSNLKFTFDPALVDLKIAELQVECPEIRIHRGCDFHLIPERIAEALQDPGKYSINHNGYLLVEFPDFLIPDSTDEIFECMVGKGLVPVLTHPERNPVLQKQIERIGKWMEIGCLVQVTAQSVTGRFGRTARKCAHDLLHRKWVHFIASDAHDTRHRPPILSEAYEWVSKDYGETTALALFVTNPQAALCGEPVTPCQAAAKAKRHWFQF